MKQQREKSQGERNTTENEDYYPIIQQRETVRLERRRANSRRVSSYRNDGVVEI